MRLRFAGLPKPLDQAGGPQELLAAVLDAVIAMENLYRLGILHRGISNTTIVINSEPQPRVGNRGFLIDLGLDPPQTNTTPIRANTHNHRPLATPFLATDLLDPPDGIVNPVIHQLHHDLESVFWLIFYTCHGDSYGANGELGSWLNFWTRQDANDPPRKFLRLNMFVLMGISLNNFVVKGKFAKLSLFMMEFADMCQKSSNQTFLWAAEHRLSFDSVKGVLGKGLAEMSTTSQGGQSSKDDPNIFDLLELQTQLFRSLDD